MYRTPALLALVLLAAPAGAEPGRPVRPDPRAAIEPFARSLLDGEYATGLVVALITGPAAPQILAWGETVRGNGKRPDGNTVFEVGSVSKAFTSLLLATLVIDKQVALDAPIATMLPAGTQLPAAHRPITLLDLATHTSGLPRLPDNLHPADPANPYADYKADDLLAFLAKATLAHEPGTRYEYSNLGAGLLGHALAQRGKTDWGSAVVAQIARPLAMTSTMVALTDDARARFAQGYDRDGEPVPPWEFAALAGAGALRSTAADLGVFVKAELAASRAPTSRLAKAMALTQAPQRNLAEDASTGKIGLGWHIKPDGLVWHNGETGGFHSYVAFQPARGLGIVVLANGSTDHVDVLGAAAMAAISGDPSPPKLDLPPRVAVDDTTLASYVGGYAVAPGFTLTFTRSGAKLYGQLTGQPRFRLHATSQKDFALRVVTASVTFEVDAKGKVTGLVLHQNGLDHRAERT